MTAASECGGRCASARATTSAAADERQNRPDDRARSRHGPPLQASRRAGLTGGCANGAEKPAQLVREAPERAAVRCGVVAEPAVPITELLLAWGAGDERALEQLVPVVYAELHRMAQPSLAARAGPQRCRRRRS